MKTCQARSSTVAQGEAYPISSAATPPRWWWERTPICAGAEENPAYRGHRGQHRGPPKGPGYQKEGTCLYPSETLVGGWCRVHPATHNGGSGRRSSGSLLKEYDKGQANWKNKPCTMIEKVAVSQAQAAFQ